MESYSIDNGLNVKEGREKKPNNYFCCYFEWFELVNIAPFESRQLDNAAITRLTNNMVEIRVVDEPWIMERDSYQPKALILPMDKVTPEALATIGIWENTADAINKSLSKAKADFGKTETLTKLKSIAKETIGSMGKTLETVKESITKTQR